MISHIRIYSLQNWSFSQLQILAVVFRAKFNTILYCRIYKFHLYPLPQFSFPTLVLFSPDSRLQSSSLNLEKDHISLREQILTYGKTGVGLFAVEAVLGLHYIISMYRHHVLCIRLSCGTCAMS